MDDEVREALQRAKAAWARIGGAAWARRRKRPGSVAQLELPSEARASRTTKDAAYDVAPRETA